MLSKVVSANSGMLILLAIGMVAAVVLGEVLKPSRKRNRGRRFGWRRIHEPGGSRAPDAADQLRIVSVSAA